MSDQSASSIGASREAGRKHIMAVLAASKPDALAELYEGLNLPAYEVIRQPETGLVMVRGRMGGTGNPFNLGEVTVTRCVVRLDSGETGSSYALGRNKKKALQAAVVDALWQRADERAKVEATVIAPLQAVQEAAEAELKSETAATKVDFFTMVRGDD